MVSMATTNLMMNVQVQKAVVFIEEAILQKKMDVSSPMSIIAAALSVVQKIGAMSLDEQKQVTLKAIERIAAGADGISGTDDDLIPVAVVQKISALLNADVVGSILDFIGGLPIPKEIAVGCAPCLTLMRSKVAPAKTEPAPQSTPL